MRTGGPKDEGPKLIGEQSRSTEIEETGPGGGAEKVDLAQETKLESDQYERQTSPQGESARTTQKQGRSGGRTVHGGGPLVAQTLTRTGELLAKLEEEADAVLRLLGDGEFSPDGIKRHAKKLERIRRQLRDGSRRRNTLERALWEAQVGLVDLEESTLSQADERLAQALEGGIAGLMALVAELGNGHDTRRLVVSGADRQAVIDYGSSTTPTTIFLDAPFVASGMFTPVEVEGDVGRTLLGQRTLELATSG